MAPILGVTEPQAKAFLALGTVGLLGPLISGTGAVGTALQDIINSDGLEEVVTTLIGAPGTVIDGAVNGGYGPNLLPLLGAFLPSQIPPIGPGAPVTGVFAPGLIPNPGFIYNPLFRGLGFKIGAGPSATLLPPGTIAVLQGLVEQVFSALPSAQSFSTLQAPTGQQQLKTSGPVGGLQTNLAQRGTGTEGQDQQGPEITPKKHRQPSN